jgi:FkbM family methyltransferase
MHNGLQVEAGGYYGDWMAEIIRVLRGHHEPQEEAVFDRIVRRRSAEGGPAVMIEFGSFWTYYGLWFCRSIPSARVIAVEPDPVYLGVGRRNAMLNDFSSAVTFLPAAIGECPGQTMSFRAESDGQEYIVEQCDLASVMRTGDIDHVDLVLADVQGAETILLERATDVLAAGRVRFLVLSTHHHSISGDPLTHQRALATLTQLGAHVICEHTVGESFSGDGLIAVSFDERDRDLVIEVSRARSRDSLFGELEYDLAAADSQRVEAQRGAEMIRLELQTAQAELRDCNQGRGKVRSQLDVTERHLAEVNREVDDLSYRLQAICGSKLWRWTQLPREEYSRLRRLRARVRP